MENRSDAAEPAVTPQELERERLRTYIDWAEVRAPVWYWPGLALAVAAWITGYGLGTFWSLAGALLVVVVSTLGVRAAAERGRVVMPRFRGMPAPLKRAYRPVVAAAAWLVAALFVMVLVDAPPYPLLGAVTGLLLALGGAWTSHRYRVAAKRLADEAGLGR